MLCVWYLEGEAHVSSCSYLGVIEENKQENACPWRGTDSVYCQMHMFNDWESM